MGALVLVLVLVVPVRGQANGAPIARGVMSLHYSSGEGVPRGAGRPARGSRAPE